MSLTIIAVVGETAVAILDYNTFIIRHWIRLPIGAILFIGGNALALWGLAKLGTHASSGLRYRLVTTGPYRYTRNPQYVGDASSF